MPSLLLAAALACAALPSADAADRARWPGASHDKPRVGVQVKIQSFTPDDARQIRQTGFDFVRFGVWTDRLDRAAYRSQLDDAFEAARSAHLPVLLTVRTLAPVGRGAVKGDANAATSTLAAAGARLADTVVQLAAQYGPDLAAVELWNEPDLSRYWPTGDVTRTFPPFADGLCRRLAGRRPATPIVGFGFARPPLPDSVPDRLLAGMHAAPPDCLDAVSYHAYGMTPAQMRAAAQDIETRYRLPAIVTEDGAASVGAGGEPRQARRLRALLDARGESGTPLISVYEWADTAHANDAAQRSYGLVHADRSPKPALDAVRASLRAAPAER
ncbi:beta-xylosidase [Burkholderia catarinensis]|uniref:beta-xylosidase n=1 Tax=Burkholderia catarinensis TaxID=1108140 RepID=UPI001FEC5EEB|nr:beta-xylosidase [Burkholderia catarinensis]